MFKIFKHSDIAKFQNYIDVERPSVLRIRLWYRASPEIIKACFKVLSKSHVTHLSLFNTYISTDVVTGLNSMKSLAHVEMKACTYSSALASLKQSLYAEVWVGSMYFDTHPDYFSACKNIMVTETVDDLDLNELAYKNRSAALLVFLKDNKSGLVTWIRNTRMQPLIMEAKIYANLDSLCETMLGDYL